MLPGGRAYRLVAVRNFVRRRHPLAASFDVDSQSCYLSERTKFPKSQTKRQFSDRLMGYSPMAASIPAAPAADGKTTESRIPTAKDVTTAGGVWAPTSAKRDKLGELRTALEGHQETLDDAATPEQLQDLYLADGLQLIAKTTDTLPDSETIQIQEFSEWLVTQQLKMPEFVEQDKLEAHLTIIEEKIDSMMAEIAADRYLSSVRDFYDPANLKEEGVDINDLTDPAFGAQDDSFAMSVLLFRLLLTRSSIEHLKASWDAMTTVSDGDVDRAAVKGELIESQASTVSVSKVYSYLFAHLSGSCADRVDSCWQLIDRDDDGLLEESEMNTVAQMCLAPVRSALVNLFEQAWDAPPETTTEETATEESTSEATTTEEVEPPKLGWRQRRKQAKTRAAMVKMFQNSCKNHFEDEVEVNHRLRCIYAWSEKAHQDNKLESIMVEDADGWSGKKRYVELNPKISLPEFRQVQKEHFTHLDRIGTEILKSFREDLWVLQGKGRERKELMRDSTIFMTAVCIADYLILAS